MKITRFFAATAIALLLSQEVAFASKLYIREFSDLGSAPNNNRPQVAKEPGTDQTPVDFTSGAALSAVFGPTTTLVRIICDVPCSFKVGTNPTSATNANSPMGALLPEYFGVNPGDKISVISFP